MCQTCSQYRPFDTDCIYSEAVLAGNGGVLRANLFEIGDAGQGASTGEAMGVYDVFFGTLDTVGDRDSIAIELTAGQAVQITIEGVGANELTDPHLRVYDENGTLVESDADRAGGRNPTDVVVAETSGTYYIEVASSRDRLVGDYQLTVTDAQLLPFYTDVQVAEYLATGFFDDNGFRSGPFAFDLGVDGSISVDITELTAEGQQFAIWGLEAWTYATGMEFTFVDADLGATPEIVFQDTDFGAYSDFLDLDGNTIVQAVVNVATGWIAVDIDASGDPIFISDSTATYLHEIGHALGLGHAGNYNGDVEFSLYVGGGDNNYINDSWQMSAMSYVYQDENPVVDADFAFTLSPMIADILAIQSLYGLDTTLRDGNTIYGNEFTTTETGLAAAVFNTPSADNMAFTLVDMGGLDTLDLSHMNGVHHIVLNDGYNSGIDGVVGNLSIFHGTIIENVLLGSNSDRLVGNEADNYVATNGGSDTINGGMGYDTVVLPGSKNLYTIENVNGTTMLRGYGTDVSVLNVEAVVFDDGAIDTMGTSRGVFFGWHLNDPGLSMQSGWTYGWHFDYDWGWTYTNQPGWEWGWHIGWGWDWGWGWHQQWDFGWNLDAGWGWIASWTYGWNLDWGWGWSWNGGGWDWGWVLRWDYGWDVAGWSFGWTNVWDWGWYLDWDFGGYWSYAPGWEFGWFFATDPGWDWRLTWSWSWDYGWDYGGWFWFAGPSWGWGSYYGWDFGTGAEGITYDYWTWTTA